MKLPFAGLLLAVAFSAWSCSSTGMSAGVQVSSAPPPPSIAFSSGPHFHSLDGYNVSVIDDDSFGYDMFSVGGSYYLYSGGYWYRSDNPTTGWVAVEERRVPRQVYDVDDQHYHWRNHPHGWHGGRSHGQGNDHHDDSGSGH